MRITDYIPTGHENAISREELRRATGLSDREMRDEIAEARHETPILNMQDGSGYFLPDKDDKEDMRLAQHYVKQEENRLKSIGWSLKAARKFCREGDSE